MALGEIQEGPQIIPGSEDAGSLMINCMQFEVNTVAGGLCAKAMHRGSLQYSRLGMDRDDKVQRMQRFA